VDVLNKVGNAKMKLKNKSRFIKILIIAAILAAGGLGAFLLYSNPPELKGSEEVPAVRQVNTKVLQAGPQALTIEGHGYVESRNSLSLISRVSGQVTFARENLRSGTEFQQGNLMIVIDDESARNSLNIAKVALIKAVATLVPSLADDGAGGAQSRWRDYLNTLNTNGGPTPVLPKVETEREKIFISNFGVYTAYYQVVDLESRLGYHNLRAPFSGVVHGNGVSLYTMVSAGMPLAFLVDPINLEVAIPLSLSELALIEDSRQVDVLIYPASLQTGGLSGSIVRTDRVLDKTSQTISVHISFENESGLSAFFPGNYVDVIITGKTIREAVRVSRVLLNSDDTVNVLKDGKLSRLPVTVLARQQDDVIISGAGLDGAEIITTVLQKPLEGMELKKAEEL
jgi:membrane fusion protein, multidrug efflux system